MDLLLIGASWFVINLVLLLKVYIFCPLVRFALGYVLYTSGAILLTVVFKLWYQVHNRRFKLKSEHCKNRVVLITGAGSGIGLALAHHFHRKQFTIVACYYSENEPGCNELRNLKQADRAGRMHLIKLDVRSLESIEASYRSVREILDCDSELRLHALINVAGLADYQRFQWTPRAAIRNLVETNLLGPVMMTRQFLHLLLKNRGARVVNVASPLGFLPVEMASVYGPTKAGLAHFTSTLESDTLKYGLQTVTIQPGNLMRNTSILAASLSDKMDKVMAELNDEERELYSDEMDEHLTKMKLMEREQEKDYNLSLSMSAPLHTNIKKLFMLVSGGLSVGKLQDKPEFILNFDNAIRLRDPPREMFAGNTFFNIVTDSIFQWMSRTLMRDLYLNIQRYSSCADEARGF